MESKKLRNSCLVISMRIKNINKKILAGTLAFILVATPLTGCAEVSIDDIKYTVNEEGASSILGSVDYDTLTYCSFYTVYDRETDERYYTIGLRDDWSPNFYVSYYDIFTGERLKNDRYAIKSIASLEEYLSELDNVKDAYTEEELKNILDSFIQKEQTNNKQKVKGK